MKPVYQRRPFAQNALTMTAEADQTCDLTFHPGPGKLKPFDRAHYQVSIAE